MKKRNQLKKMLLMGALGTVMTVSGVTVTMHQVTAMAADDPTSQTAADVHTDQDKVAFTDPAFGTAVAKALGVDGDVTYGDIRHYQGQQPVLQSNANITSLEGLQSLQELPDGIGVSVQLSLARGVSLAPFKGLPVSGNLTVLQDGMHGGDFTALNQVHVLEDPTASVLRQVCVSGQTYYADYDGLTDADVQQLKPLFSQFAALKHKNYDGRIRITVANQRLTSFSFFKQFGPVELLAIGQYQVFEKPIYIDPATFTQETQVRIPAPMKGMNDEPVQTSSRVWYNASGKLAMDGTDALVKGINAGTKWLVLGHRQNHVEFENIDPIPYADGSTLVADGYQYYPIDWEKAPEESSNSSSSTTETPGKETSQSDESSHDSVNSSSEADQIVAPKGSVVYAVKPIYLYDRPTFKRAERQAKYVKQPRINRPMFVVTGYAKSVNGHARYLVKDVNHHSKTAGKTGYITANTKYTVPVYYQKKAAKITVINPAGVNAYRQVGLKKRATHYRQGTTLKVTGLKHYHLTTRFKLSNGTYVTANRKLVTTQKTTTPTAIRTKTTVNRYRTVNLTGKRGTIAAKKRVKVLGWDYAQPNNFNKYGALRYRVAGGYITANSRYVQVIH
ncbi:MULTISPECIES: DUF5776 domain-containing protein [Lactobacillaceae]|uniref:DUF5776 domain-containing protein n=1 Tax=Lactobacillaceae TaxID=33958 RepID=UPI0014569FF3|nr:DUF5776 domain-containing protein [Lactobacillus sp. HBUAS51381]NLR08445.1 hypothetical protein [Lactobacillus sp. HBUAS51381]